MAALFGAPSQWGLERITQAAEYRRNCIPAGPHSNFRCLVAVSATFAGITNGTLTSQSPWAACIHASWHAMAFSIRRCEDQPHEQAAYELPTRTR